MFRLNAIPSRIKLVIIISITSAVLLPVIVRTLAPSSYEAKGFLRIGNLNRTQIIAGNEALALLNSPAFLNDVVDVLKGDKTLSASAQDGFTRTFRARSMPSGLLEIVVRANDQGQASTMLSTAAVVAAQNLDARVAAIVAVKKHRLDQLARDLEMEQRRMEAQRKLLLSYTSNRSVNCSGEGLMLSGFLLYALQSSVNKMQAEWVALSSEMDSSSTFPTSMPFPPHTQIVGASALPVLFLVGIGAGLGFFLGLAFVQVTSRCAHMPTV